MLKRVKPKILSWVALSALAGLSLGVLVWSLIVGFAGKRDEPNYFILPITGLVDHWLLFAASASLVGVGVALITLRRRRRGDIADVRIALPLLVAFGFAGYGYAVLTAPVVGANIGAGMVVLASPLVAVVTAAWFYRSLRRCRAA